MYSATRNQSLWLLCYFTISLLNKIKFLCLRNLQILESFVQCVFTYSNKFGLHIIPYGFFSFTVTLIYGTFTLSLFH